MPRVLIPSLRYKMNGDNFEPIVDIAPAAQFGEITYLTTPGNNVLHAIAIDQVRRAMAESNEDDMIMLTGDTVLVSVAIGEYAAMYDKIRVLRWHSRDNEYRIEEWDWPIGEIIYLPEELES
jgi:hypothetical protein